MHKGCELLLTSPEFPMESFTLTLPTGSAVFDGTNVVITPTNGEAITYSVASGTTPTVVDVKQGEEIQINEEDASAPAS